MAASQLHAERLLKAPCGLATDKEDNFYIVDLQNGRGAIYKHDPDGKRLSEPTEGFANDGIGDIALDKANGIIYFTTPSSPYIWKLDLNGEVPYKPEHFALWDTTGLAVDSAGNVYVAAADSLRKLNRNGDSVATVQLGDVSKVLAVDSQGRIYYATDQGKKLKRATPKCETPQYEGDYTLEDIDTGGAYDVVAIDEADNLYIADKEKATIRKHGPGATASQEFVVPGHFGDLRALTVAGDKLYIANGVDGVLKVVAATGECFGSKLFSWKDEPDQPQYFVRTANDNYYIAFGNRILQFDQKRDKTLIWQGHEAGGVGLDKNGSLVFLGSEAGYAANYIYWRQNNKSEFKQWLFSSGPGSLSVRGNDVCFTNGRSLFCATLKPESNKIDIDAIPTATSLERWDGVVRNKSGTLYVDSPNNKVYGARSVLITVPIIEGLDHPRAIAVDENEAIYVTNEGSKPHIRKYGYNYGNTKHLSDLVMKDSMKDFRDLFVDDDGSAVVLQADGVWKYSNIFAW